VLAGVVLSNVVPYLETIYELPNLWRQNQYDCVSAEPREEGQDGGGMKEVRRGQENISNPLNSFFFFFDGTGV
jgi:hypothetical protein